MRKQEAKSSNTIIAKTYAAVRAAKLDAIIIIGGNYINEKIKEYVSADYFDVKASDGVDLSGWMEETMTDIVEPNGGSLVAGILKKREITHIYSCPGTTEMSIIVNVLKSDGMHFILFPFEGPAVAAADGHSRVTGRPQVVMLHANVGLANGISQIYSAKMSYSPIVVINVIKPRALLSHGGITSTTHEQEMVKQYTKWDWMVLRSEELAEDLNRAFQMAIKPPSGPTLLVIPQDVLESQIKTGYPYSLPESNIDYRISPAEEDVSKAVNLLDKCRSPLIIAGSGVGRDNCINLVEKLAELLGAGVCCESKWSFYNNGYSTGSDYFLGPYGLNNPAVREADVILALGAKLFAEFTMPKEPMIPNGARLIHQHNDLTEIDKLYHADIALCGNTKETVEILLAKIEAAGDRGRKAETRKLKISQFRALRNEAISKQIAEAKNKEKIQVISLVESISKVMDNKTTAVVDTPTSDFHLVEYLERHNELSFYGQACGSLGWGTGAAVGVKCGAPERKVICITGDGCLLFGVQSLWVAVKYRIPVVFLVINNAGYAAIRKGLLHYKGDKGECDNFPGTNMSGIDYCLMARSFGMAAERICQLSGIQPAVERALAKDKPYLLEVMIDPKDY
ncbi:MAG: thiamine pyrophosphate-binding protein [Bacillota bacterium]